VGMTSMNDDEGGDNSENEYVKMYDGEGDLQ
jgi:hypothetical protein